MNFRSILSFSILVLMSLTLANNSTAQDIWENRDPALVRLFETIRARRVGDVLTVVVTETTTLNQAVNRAMNKQSTAQSGFNGSYSYGGDIGNGTSNGAGSFNVNSARNNNGNSSFSDARTFFDQLSVRVVDVLPNKNLVISGSRQFKAEGDLRTLTVTGIVRNYDIQANNAIASNMISDLKIDYKSNSTPQKSFTKQGWLAKRINKIWPF